MFCVPTATAVLLKSPEVKRIYESTVCSYRHSFQFQPAGAGTHWRRDAGARRRTRQLSRRPARTRSDFSTGIALEQHAVAIPHCEAVHAKSPAIYLIRPDAPVFQRADDDGEIDVSLIIALIVENPAAQLKLLRRLFSELQNPHTLEALLAASDDQLPVRFQQFILEPELNAVAS
jgi:PTS system galactitol-specific IIA component